MSCLLDHSQYKNISFSKNHASIEMKNVVSVILAGGEGTRLHPLTLTRSKPAINFGGKYRLIDVPISNSIHANCYKTFILTQFLASSLHNHIFQTYMQGGSEASQIELLTAEQKPSKKSWFEGTADAVRQNIDRLLDNPVEYFLILSGDQLYNIDFNEMLSFAKNSDADAVIAALPITARDTKRMGVLQIDQNHILRNFHEKPQSKQLLQLLQHSTHTQPSKKAKDQRNYLGSMGIYLFKRESLVNLLKNDLREDFGKHLIPTLVETGKVAAFIHQGYWEDIGTIETFYNANMALLDPTPQFSFYNERRPIFSCRYDLPPARFLDGTIKQSMICDGSIVYANEVTHSILGPRTVIHEGTIIRNSYLFGNDYYRSTMKAHHPVSPIPHIAENCIVLNSIIDKNASIGKNVQLINRQKILHYNGDNIFIRDGIIIVPSGATIPDNFVL